MEDCKKKWAITRDGFKRHWLRKQIRRSAEETKPIEHQSLSFLFNTPTMDKKKIRQPTRPPDSSNSQHDDLDTFFAGIANKMRDFPHFEVERLKQEISQMVDNAEAELADENVHLLLEPECVFVKSEDQADDEDMVDGDANNEAAPVAATPLLSTEQIKFEVSDFNNGRCENSQT